MFCKFLRTETAYSFNSVNCVVFTIVLLTWQYSHLSSCNSKTLLQNFATRQPTELKTQPKCLNSIICRTLPTVHFPSPYVLSHSLSNALTLSPTSLYQKNERVPPGNSHSCIFFYRNKYGSKYDLEGAGGVHNFLRFSARRKWM